MSQLKTIDFGDVPILEEEEGAGRGASHQLEYRLHEVEWQLCGTLSVVTTERRPCNNRSGRSSSQPWSCAPRARWRSRLLPRLLGLHAPPSLFRLRAAIAFAAVCRDSCFCCRCSSGSYTAPFSIAGIS